jgi:hypothetical protein
VKVKIELDDVDQDTARSVIIDLMMQAVETIAKSAIDPNMEKLGSPLFGKVLMFYEMAEQIAHQTGVYDEFFGKETEPDDTV